MAERIEIIVTTDASAAAGELDQLADQVEALTGVRPEVTVAAETEEATSGLDAVSEIVDEMDAADVALDVSAPGAADAVGELEAVAGAADDAADAAADMGDAAAGGIGSIKGTAKDVVRPLGLARSSVGDLTDALQLMTDKAIESGIVSPAAVGKIAAALPAIGVAIGVAVSAWQAFQKEEKAAAEAADKLRDAYRGVGDALAAGDPVAAAEALTAANEDLYASAADLGVPYQELTDFITGATDEMPTLEAAHGRLGDETAELAFGVLKARDAFTVAAEAGGTLGSKTDAASTSIDTYTESVGGAADAAEDLAGWLDDVNTELDLQSDALSVAGAIDTLETSLRDAGIAAYQFGAGSEEASDANRDLAGDLIDAKQDVIDYAEAVGNIPPEEITKILALLDQGKIAEAEAAFDELSRGRAVPVKADAETGEAEKDLGYLSRNRTAKIYAKVTGGNPGAGGPYAPQGTAAMPTADAAPTVMAAAAPAPVVNVTVDARGAIDPYSVGLAVERAAGAWGRVSGQWRPGRRAG